MSVTVEELITTLTGSGLMAREEVDEFLAGLSEGEKPEDGEQLAKLLYRSEKLTKFQTQCVYQGKTRGLVLGNYVVLDRIGQGGMGHVFKAQHKKMRRVVALKVLPSQVSRQKGAVERFHREVVAAARLTHQNIVTAYDADDADGVHFLVMELVEGVDLSKLVRRKGSLSVAKAIDYVTQAATGLQYAHDQGVVHRDIKPSNLLLDQSGTVKILDMGLARFERELHESTAAQSLTHSGQMMGTLDYMAPEQAMDTHNASAAADIYSLGCTLYYLLTGESVYPGETVAMKIIAHREESVPSLRDRRDDVSPRLEQVFQRMLAKEPEGRQGSMAEVIRELEACRGSGEESHETAAFSLGPTGGDPTVDQSPQDRDMTVASAPPPIPSGSGSSADNWLQAELPEAPTVLRPMSGAGRRKGRKKSQQQLIVFGSIAAAGLVVLIVAIVFAFSSPEKSDVATEVNLDEAEASVVSSEKEPKVDRTASAESQTGDAESVERVAEPKLVSQTEPGSQGHDLRDSAVPPALAVAPFDAAAAKRHQQAWAAHLGVPVEFTNSLGMTFILIPPGEFMMGSTEDEIADLLKIDQDPWWQRHVPIEGPQHRVRITRPFYLGKHEVTVDAFRAFAEAAGYETVAETSREGGRVWNRSSRRWEQRSGITWQNPSFTQSDNHPVTQVCWNDCAAFCRWLSEEEGKAYALPTEAQWEYACRSGSTTRWFFGNNEAAHVQYAHCNAIGGTHTHPVGEKRPNAFGLFDMYGNVREWCADPFGEDYYRSSPVDDPVGPTVSSKRVIRGGNWNFDEKLCRSAGRRDHSPEFRSSGLGFRVAAVSVGVPRGAPVAHVDTTTPAPLSFDGNLAGTTWQVTDSAGDEYVFMFQSDGVLHYEAERGLRKNGTWKKVGNKVEIEMNNGYASLEGTLSGAEISGEGASRNGTSWTWRAELQ